MHNLASFGLSIRFKNNNIICHLGLTLYVKYILNQLLISYFQVTIEPSILVVSMNFEYACGIAKKRSHFC